MLLAWDLEDQYDMIVRERDTMWYHAMRLTGDIDVFFLTVDELIVDSTLNDNSISNTEFY